MHRYFIKTPWLVKQIFRGYEWDVPTNRKAIYLTFDDGPHPQVTPWVLDQLKTFNAKGSFFCIGNNVEAYPEIYQRILHEGHVTGNHTYHHLNGWTTDVDTYVQDVDMAQRLIPSCLFRPPYGRIRHLQARAIKKKENGKMRIIMWDVLSADFDNNYSEEDCLNNVLVNAGRGSIVVFHDSEKARRNLMYSLPKVLEHFRREGYAFETL